MNIDEALPKLGPFALLFLGLFLGFVLGSRKARGPKIGREKKTTVHASRDQGVEVWIALYSHAIEARREVSKRVAAIATAGLALTAALIALKAADPMLGYVPGIVYTLALYCTVIPLTATTRILAANTNAVFDQIVAYRPDPIGPAEIHRALRLPDPAEWNMNRLFDGLGHVLIILALFLSAAQLFFSITCPQSAGMEFQGFKMCRVTSTSP